MKNPEHARGNHPGRILFLSALAAVAFLIALCLQATPVRSADNEMPGPKTQRQIGIMEGILDQVLVDSPNFRVFGRDNARGIYLSEFGALFTFEASLTDSPWFSGIDLSGALEGLRSGFAFGTGKNGDVYYLDTPDSSEGEPPDSDLRERHSEQQKKDERDLERERERLEKARAKAEQALEKSRETISRYFRTPPPEHPPEKVDPAVLYKRGKEELVQALFDYGATLTALRDDQSVAIAAFLRDSDYFRENKLSRLILKARMRDLREYSAGRISDGEMRSRMTVEEY
jgi:hypothetical protein